VVSIHRESEKESVLGEVWSGGIPTAASVTVGREDLHPARNNIHLLVDAFPPSPQYHSSQPYMKEDDENAWRHTRILEGEDSVTHMHYWVQR